MVLSLVVTCLVAAVALAGVYGITKPVIEKQASDAVNAALSEVLPSAERFEPVEPDSLWYGLDAAGQKVGIVLRTAPRGYGGPVTTMAGVGLDGRVVGVKVAAEGLKETPGLGLKALEPRFRDQFTGKTAAEVRLRKDGGTVDAISAATITSRAVAQGLSSAIEKYASHLAP
jgi:electron transport complex protein RnfG